MSVPLQGAAVGSYIKSGGAKQWATLDGNTGGGSFLTTRLSKPTVTCSGYLFGGAIDSHADALDALLTNYPTNRPHARMTLVHQTLGDLWKFECQREVSCVKTWGISCPTSCQSCAETGTTVVETDAEARHAALCLRMLNPPVISNGRDAVLL